MTKKYLFLILIIATAFLVRTIRLADRPAGLTWDEAALGYNSFSLLKTGADEHGQIMPLVFKSFGDYKPGLYVYITVPFTAVFGLNEFSTRLPSAIVGTLLIIAVYLLTSHLSGTRSGLFASVMLTISPWAIIFSRGAWEANLALLLTTLGATLFLRKKFVLASIMLGLTFWTYQGSKLFTPLILLALLVSLRPKWTTLVRPLAVLTIFVFPLIVNLKTQSGRLRVFSLFNYTRTADSINQILNQDTSTTSSPLFVLYHSEVYDQLRGIVQRYLNHLSPRFLFSEGDWSNPRHALPFYGYLHFPEVIPIILGLYALIMSKSHRNKLIWLWLLLSPLPSALSRDIVSGVRSLPMVIPLSVIGGIGLSVMFKNKLMTLVYFAFLAFSTVYFMDLYFVHSPFYFSKYWMTPYKQAVAIVNQNKDKYNRIVFSTSLGQPYIYFLYYNKIDPRFFLSHSKSVDNIYGDVGEVSFFDGINFEKINWPAERTRNSVLLVGDKYEIPDHPPDQSNLIPLAAIPYVDGSSGLYVVGLK